MSFAAVAATRFRVGKCEAVVIDQYRMLHAREPFVGGRLMFRLHCWSTDRLHTALPTNCNCGCGTPGRHPELMRGRRGSRCTHNRWIRSAPPVRINNRAPCD